MGVSMESGVTSPITGQVSYGWISDAWRLFSAQMGVWVAATAVLLVPIVVFIATLYAVMWTTMFPHGLIAPPPPPHGLPTSPLAAQASMNARMAGLMPWEIGISLGYNVWAAYLYGGMFRMAVRQVRGLPIAMGDIFRGGRLFGRMLGAFLLLVFGAYFLEAVCAGPAGLLIWRHGPVVAAVAAGVGGVLLLFGLVLTATGVLLPSFALMADGDGVLTALKRSIRAMKSRWAGVAGLVFVLGVLVYVSEIPCGVGLLATFPMVFLVCALAYRDMVGMPNMVPPPAPVYPAAELGAWPPAPVVSTPDR